MNRPSVKYLLPTVTHLPYDGNTSMKMSKA